ncbi:hypothetical protein F3N42_13690 [Marinihelvus fidelis]|uniref:Outer membrane protein assembly factor BamC n=1 Tax=Marinihelvus fidelis TaxID=2613842 RepID=A0A5N0T4P5_9GAMM|nr:hypothetical protein [Marinihelvus fidelis]KAA9129832.1 hypothetical protein F3N42_13690 [Marinihelvus fidelis]
MLKSTTRAAALALFAVLAGGCSWFKDRPPEYLAATEAPRVKVPEGMDQPPERNPVLITVPEMRMPAGDELNPSPPRVVNTGGQGRTDAFMAWSAEGAYLQVNYGTDEVARRIGLSIQSEGMDLLSEGANGGYRFEYSHAPSDPRAWWQKMAFWTGGDIPNYSGVYRTRIEPDGKGARVFLMQDTGQPASTGAAEHVLGIFMEDLG